VLPCSHAFASGDSRLRLSSIVNGIYTGIAGQPYDLSPKVTTDTRQYGLSKRATRRHPDRILVQERRANKVWTL